MEKQDDNRKSDRITNSKYEGMSMASLTHVCMWHENGWKRISAEEAAGLHPVGTVSACSGLFMCELCG